MNRRTFLQAGASAAIGALAGSGLAFAADAEIELSPGEAGAVISPHIYGHFIEHLGGVIYDGVWVGRNSSIPNVDGIRKQFVDDMKRIGARISAGPAAALPTAITGATGSATHPEGPALTTSGNAACPPESTPPRPTSLAFTNSCICAAWSALSHTSP